MKKSRNYFSFFGILMASSNAILSKFQSRFENYISKFPSIKNILIKSELKPIKQYLTNNL
ncbi:hypothetical protein [Arcobacter vandammei]|uniref:hypothetical protein n=1 Tax=Arcobacter vandammei TaxID=2782243 RepID=UPI0018DF9359|nr:hypothetical protein [Arcobacter vandammei]